MSNTGAHVLPPSVERSGFDRTSFPATHQIPRSSEAFPFPVFSDPVITMPIISKVSQSPSQKSNFGACYKSCGRSAAC
jgi:hypothetical protein